MSKYNKNYSDEELRQPSKLRKERPRSVRDELDDLEDLIEDLAEDLIEDIEEEDNLKDKES